MEEEFQTVDDILKYYKNKEKGNEETKSVENEQR